MSKRKRKQVAVGRARRVTGENIRRLREARGWTQEELGDHSGLAAAHVGRIERGELDCGLTTLESLALALGTDIGALVTDQALRTLYGLKEDYAAELGVFPAETREGLLQVVECVLMVIKAERGRKQT